MPATTEVTPSVLVMDKLAREVRVSVSVALTDEASVAAAVTVFARVPVADDLTEATMV